MVNIMKNVFIKGTILFITINILEIIFLLYAIFCIRDATIAILFPALVPVIIAIVFSKNAYSAKTVISLVSMQSLCAIQIVFAILFGDDGTLIGMLFFSFIFTLLPSLIYIIYAGITTLLHSRKKRSKK